MKSSRVFASMMALLFVGAAVVCHAQDSVKLTRKVAKGDIYRSKFVGKFSVMGLEIVIEQLAIDEVKEIKPNGHIVVHSRIEGGKVIVMGMEMPIPEADASTMVRDERWRLVEFKDLAGDMSFTTTEVHHLLSAMMETVLPEGPVKAGDKWTVEFDNPAAKGKKAIIKAEFVGIEKVGDETFWKVKQSGEGQTDSAGAKMSFEYTALLKPSNGEPHKVEGVVRDLPTNQGGPITITFEQTLRKAT